MGVVQAKIQTVEDIYQMVLGGRGEQTSHSSQLSRPGSVVLPSPAGPESRRPDPCALLSVWRGEQQWTASSWLAG